ncbi:TonB-dependent receptor domain-containing protein [Phenylobacterium sp. VNQ135]|uniref:TonB-dependent receptor domain-containing protein n=1 Tax=Phenylobacterium sp. VNQ135 TaxID=3400922 RepID=UPI003BFB8295
MDHFKGVRPTSPDDPYTPMVDTRDRFLRKTTALSAELTWDLAGGVLTSRTSGKWVKQKLYFDRDALFGQPFNTSAAAGREFWVGFRDTTIDAYQQSLDYTHAVTLFGLSGDFAGGVEFLADETERFSYEGTICALVPTPAVCPRANPANANNIAAYHVKSKSYSGFASLNLSLTERLEMTIEGRLIHDTADFDGAQEFGSNAVRVYDRFINPARRSDSLKSTDFSPAVSAKFAVTDNSNIFGRIATGYRAGGFNDRTGNTLSPTRTDLLPGTFDPETNISYELGFKGEYSSVPVLDSVFLDIAGYYIESDDVIIDSTATVINPSDSIINNKNGGTSEQYGVEVQVRTRTRLGENTLVTTYIGMNYAEGFYTDPDARANPTINAATGMVTVAGAPIFGNRIPLLPKWQASASLGVEHTIGEHALFATLGYTGEWQQAHDQAQTQPFTRRVADRALFDLSAGYRNEDYTVRGVVKNLFDNQFWLAPAVAAQGRTARTNLPTEWRFEVTRRF